MIASLTSKIIYLPNLQKLTAFYLQQLRIHKTSFNLALSPAPSPSSLKFPFLCHCEKIAPLCHCERSEAIHFYLDNTRCSGLWHVSLRLIASVVPLPRNDGEKACHCERSEAIHLYLDSNSMLWFCFTTSNKSNFLRFYLKLSILSI